MKADGWLCCWLSGVILPSFLPPPRVYSAFATFVDFYQEKKIHTSMLSTWSMKQTWNIATAVIT